jgi:hypothetical protein
MQTYFERSQQVVLDSSIAVMVLLNSDNTDLEFWMIAPHEQTASELTSREEFAARKLRSVGVVGLRGIQSLVAFKEPLDTFVVARIATAFADYVRVLMGQSLVHRIQEQKGDAVEWLERLYALEDPRARIKPPKV